MVLDYPFVWPPWNTAENSQRQACRHSLTLSEGTTRDGLRLASRTPQKEDTPKSWTKVRYRIGHIRPFGKSMLQESICKD
jgi:hypothetical protein